MIVAFPTTGLPLEGRVRECGQHCVDRERDERHEKGDEGHELAGARHGPHLLYMPAM